MDTSHNLLQGEFDTLESIADAISEALSCPVTIEDQHHRLLSYSSHNQALTDKARLATIMGRRVPEEVINSLWEAGVIKKLSDSDDPVRITPIESVGLGPRVAIAIRRSRNLLGYIWLIEVKPLGSDEFNYLKKASAAVSIKLLQLRDRRKREKEDLEEFFWRMLTGHVGTHEDIVEDASRLRVALPKRYSIVILQFDKDVSSNVGEQIHYVVSTMQQTQAVFSVTDRSQIILLIDTFSKKITPDEFSTNFILTVISRMQERFGHGPSFAGSGNSYSGYDKIRNSYHEALLVLKLKQCFREELLHTFAYSNLGFYRYLPLIAEQSKKEEYMDGALQKIRDYDMRHQANLIETLQVFLDCDSNIKQAADILHVHINTLNYRLKRISEIGSVDLHNPDQKFSLYLNLKLEKFLT
jgi:DNA-binding PucR family transcriptional regulator